MNLVPSQALLADPDRKRRARVRRELLRELPGIEVAEAADSDTVIRALERQRFDLAIVRHPLPPDPSLPLVLKKRWPEHVLLLYAPVESEQTLAEALSTAGDAYFLDSGTALPGLRAALRLACGRLGTDRRLQRSDRLRSLEWFAAIFQASPVGIGLGTADDGRFFDVNDRFLELLGRERQEVLGRTWTELGVTGPSTPTVTTSWTPRPRTSAFVGWVSASGRSPGRSARAFSRCSRSVSTA